MSFCLPTNTVGEQPHIKGFEDASTIKTMINDNKLHYLTFEYVDTQKFCKIWNFYEFQSTKTPTKQSKQITDHLY